MLSKRLTLFHIFNALTFAELTDRPIIKADFEPKYPKYIAILNADFDRIQEILERNVISVPVRERTAIYQQFPPYSASIHWARDMQNRIDENMAQFQSLNLNVEEIKDLVASLDERHTALSKTLKDFQDQTCKDWISEVEAHGSEWMNEFLFTDGNDLDSIVVNFRPEASPFFKIFSFQEFLNTI